MRSNRVQVRLAAPLLDALRALADVEGVPVERLVRRAVGMLLFEREDDPAALDDPTTGRANVELAEAPESREEELRLLREGRAP
jgi:hypothetical protein